MRVSIKKERPGEWLGSTARASSSRAGGATQLHDRLLQAALTESLNRRHAFSAPTLKTWIQWNCSTLAAEAGVVRNEPEDADQ